MTNKPSPLAYDHSSGQGGGVDCSHDHLSYANDQQDQHPQYTDRVVGRGDPNDDLTYGYDGRANPSKEKSGSGHSNKLKKFGAFFAEPRRDTRPEQNYETDKDRYRRERNEYKHRCRDLEERHGHNISIIKQLQDDLRAEKDQVSRTKRSANLLETTMENKEIFLGAQARNDDEVRGKFKSIISSIKTWSNNFNAGVGHAFSEDMLLEYQRVAPLCTQMQYLEKVVDDKKRKRLFVRGWAAYIMTKLLFRTLDPLGDLGTDVWMSQGLGDHFARLENELWFTDRKLITHRAFNDWRAFTADLLSKSIADNNQKSDDETHRVVQDAVNDVMDLVVPWCISSDRDALNGYGDRLYKIFLEAVELAQFLRRQRALWSIRFPSRPSLPDMPETGPLMFDPEKMRDDKGDDEDVQPEKLRLQYVDIVVTPTLSKRGNTNGEKFDHEEVAEPAIVVMKTS